MRLSLFVLLAVLTQSVLSEGRKIPGKGEVLAHQPSGELRYLSDLIGGHVFWVDEAGEPVPLKEFLEIYDACIQNLGGAKATIHSQLDQCYLNKGYKLHAIGAE